MKERSLILIFGILFLSGIILAGSDGTWFPWPNVLGLLLTALAVLVSQKVNLQEHPPPAASMAEVTPPRIQANL